MKKLIVGISGASGAIYGIRVLEVLRGVVRRRVRQPPRVGPVRQREWFGGRALRKSAGSQSLKALLSRKRVMRISNNVFFLNTILLGGSSTEAKLSAAKAAGFDQVELWRQDVEAAGGDTKAIVAILKRLGLGLTDYQVLLDFDGAPEAIREAKRAEALRMLDTAVAVGANTLLTPAGTRKDCVADRIEEDLRWLAREAAQRGLRVAYEAMAWSTFNHYTPDAWQTLKNVGEKNLGMVIDAFHIFIRHRTATDLEGIPAERIFLVQLSDLNHDLTRDTVVDTARHHRLLPGQGTFPLDTILQALRAKSYAGPIGLEVFNDDLKAQGPNQAARSAMTAFQSVLSKSMATECSE